MSFGDAFYSVLGSATGSALVGGVMNLFTDDDPAPTSQVGGGPSGKSANTKATEYAALAQQKTTAGIQAGKIGKAFEAHDAVNKFTTKHVNKVSVRERIVAELIAKGAPPAFIQNVKKQWKISDESLQPRKALSQTGFAQQPYAKV